MSERAKVSIDSISGGAKLAQGKKDPDDKDKLEEKSLSSRRQKAEIGALEQANRDRVATRRLRYRYAKAVYCYLVGYSAGAAALVLLAGWKPLGFSIPDIALTAIVGSTAAAAVGLVGFVVSG